ncbi:MAG: hypothetical protein ACXACR_08035, partial [Candidatus Hodarchaeales archaeon]
MSKQERLITLKDAVIYTNHAEENIRLQISRGLLNKYDKKGEILANPLQEKGFFKLSELLEVYDITEDPEEVKKKFFARKHNTDSEKEITPKRIIKLSSSEIDNLENVLDESIDTWILSPVFNTSERQGTINFEKISKFPIVSEVNKYLREAQRILKPHSNILIHSIPQQIPYYGVTLTNLGFFFKYWIVYSIEYPSSPISSKFVPEANGILYFVKSAKKFRINRVRDPYRDCSFCSEPLKDYGGKKHLRHIDGMVTSDIWHVNYDLPKIDYTLPSPILQRLINLSCTNESSLLLAPFDGEIPN